MNEEGISVKSGVSGILLRLFFFFALEIAGLFVFSTLLDELFGRMAAGALGTFAATVLANSLTVRIFERGRLEDVGMGWRRVAQRHLLLGLAGGVLAGSAVAGGLIAFGFGHMQPSPEAAFSLGKLLWVSTMLLFGAVGEELFFRGYGFQLLINAAGPWWVIPASGVLFGAAHAGNMNVSWLGIINTGLWGMVLGYAYFRAGDLWLPIGLHFGWNWLLPLLGANLSGFTLGLAGYVIVPRGNDLLSGGTYGPEASVFTTVAALTLGVWLWKARLGQPKPEPEA